MTTPQEPIREMRKPVEEVAQVIWDYDHWNDPDEAAPSWDWLKKQTDPEITSSIEPTRGAAAAVLAYLTSHGFLTLDAIVAIQAEKKGAGE